MAELENLYIPLWMRDTPMEDVFVEAWIENNGNVQMALDQVRDTEVYDQIFQGNKYADGSIRYEEQRYVSVKESFENILLSVDVNPDLFQHQFGNLIAGNVSPAEFATRVNSLYARVIDDVSIAAYYNEQFGTELSDSGIMASFLDPDIGQAILDKQIAMSEVGGNAASRGFDVGVDFAKQLVNAGMDSYSEAAQFFSLAEGAIPILQTLAARHADPDDTFDLNEFATAQIFGDPEMRRRIQRLQAQERASFSSGVGQSSLIAPDQGGRLTGLQVR